MSSDIIVGAAIALFSGIAGAFFQAIVSRRSDYIKAGRQARYNAYADYFKGVALLTHPSNEQDNRAVNSLIADARGRIALYGSPEVVVAMTKAFRHGDDLSSAAARSDLSDMIAAMRADVIWIDPAVEKQQLYELLYGKDRGASA